MVRFSVPVVFLTLANIITSVFFSVPLGKVQDSAPPPYESFPIQLTVGCSILLAASTRRRLHRELFQH
jgi:hypothetical protein